MWTRAYAQFCARVYNAEQLAIAADQREATKKHLLGLWAALGVRGKARQSKIRAIGSWFTSLPERDREVIIERLPATKEAVYVATSHAPKELTRILGASGITPESTTAEWRRALGRGTPQDSLRSRPGRAEVPSARVAPETEGIEYRVVLVCLTEPQRQQVLAFAAQHGIEVIESER
jgi:hypothetical protein